MGKLIMNRLLQETITLTATVMHVLELLTVLQEIID